MTARVLVVDDMLPNVKLLEAKLTSEYFEVMTAHDGPSALELIGRQPPDIILLDVMMPGMDGFEVCERIKADPRTLHIPVVMVTALSDAADRVRGIEAGADDFLTKPVNDVALFARVRSLVRLKMMMDEWRMREETSGQLGALKTAMPMLAEDAARARVLVLDDQALDAQKIAHTLASDNDSVEIVTTVAEAYRLAAETPFDLIIVNLNLEGEDALRLCSQLRSADRTRHIPILVAVEDGHFDRLAKGFELGINDYLIKPVDRNELLARARTQIRRWRYHERLKDDYERSIEMALTDSLTGLYNRRYLTAHLEGQLKRMVATGKALGLMIFDIDNFKSVNDSYGHPVGDEVLQELARRVTHNLRDFDMVARFGGEEFVVVMPDTDREIARMVAERLRNYITDTPFSVSALADGLPITVSIGVATADPSGASSAELLKLADDALLEAKRAGRNRVVVAPVKRSGRDHQAAAR